MMIGMGLFWVAVILGVAWLVRDGATAGSDHRRRPDQDTGSDERERS